MATIKLPAGIDIHVHFREPGFTYKETMSTGMEAAKAGGVYTVLDMPNTKPVTDSPQHLQNKLLLANQFNGVNLAAGLTNHAVKSGYLSKMAKINPIFKVFMANSTGDLGIDDNNLFQGLQILGSLELPILLIFHAEDPSLVSSRYEGCIDNQVRPPEAEIKSIEKILEIRENLSKNIVFHITHVSTSKSANMLNEKDMSFDVLHKHLFLDETTVQILGNKARMNPPLRSKKEREDLYELFLNEKIPIIASDHAPHTIEDKLNLVAGAPGVQELYPLLINQMLEEKISKNYLQRVIYENPKSLLVKYGAEIVEKTITVDTTQEYTLEKSLVKSKCKWSLWEGQTLKGKIL